MRAGQYTPHHTHKSVLENPSPNLDAHESDPHQVNSCAAHLPRVMIISEYPRGWGSLHRVAPYAALLWPLLSNCKAKILPVWQKIGCPQHYLHCVLKEPKNRFVYIIALKIIIIKAIQEWLQQGQAHWQVYLLPCASLERLQTIDVHFLKSIHRKAVSFYRLGSGVKTDDPNRSFVRSGVLISVIGS